MKRRSFLKYLGLGVVATATPAVLLGALVKQKDTVPYRQIFPKKDYLLDSDKTIKLKFDTTNTLTYRDADWNYPTDPDGGYLSEKHSPDDCNYFEVTGTTTITGVSGGGNLILDGKEWWG